jgi:hypothetical protein
MNIIGLGKAGCAIAEKFGEYPEYKIFQIDVDKEGPRCYNIKRQRGPEEYEANTPSLKKFFGKIGGDTTFVIGGSGDISAMSLRIMEQIKNKCDIDILYITPDKSLLSEKRKTHEKVTYKVLQNYARSGAIQRIYLVSNPQIENILGEVPIMGYFDRLNDFIVSTIHMVNVFRHAGPVMGGLRSPGTTRRISTVGIYDMEKDEEKLFFSLDTIRETSYIYCVGEKRLREDGALHKNIVTQMKGKTNNEIIDVSFGVFPTNYENDYGYVLAHSPNIQS